MIYKIDGKDKEIIGILEKHGDYTTRQIARKTLIPPTTINNRIRKLKKEGIIKNFTVNLDYKKIDRGFLVYILVSADILTLKEKKKSQYDIAKQLMKFDFVEKADIVSGGTDIVAIVRVKDVDEFDNALLEHIQNIEGVRNTQSLIVIHQR
ncbi:MAG: Lrp/AsnC family transcriptional regulator [archaeon]